MLKSGGKSYQDIQAERFEVPVSEPTVIENLDFKVDALRKVIIDPIDKVVQDLVPPVAQGSDKLLERLEWGGFNLGHPFLSLGFGLIFCDGMMVLPSALA